MDGGPMVESLRADTQKDTLSPRPQWGWGQFPRLSTWRADPWLLPAGQDPEKTHHVAAQRLRLRPRPRPGPRAESQPRRPAAHTHPLCLVRPLCAGPKEGGLEDTRRDSKGRGWPDLGVGQPWCCCCVLEQESPTCLDACRQGSTWWGHPLGTLSARPGRGGGGSVPGASELAVPAVRLHHGGEDLQGGRVLRVPRAEKRGEAGSRSLWTGASRACPPGGTGRQCSLEAKALRGLPGWAWD